PFRGEVDRILLTLPDKLANDKTYADRIDGLKRDLLARPELAALTRDIWANIKTFIDRSASGESNVLQHHLANVFLEAG
ncbi:hypothetical protein QIG40_27020, partial [Klebsiella pneumoniae]|nr:hypothetical protein [Klebsiella pneumoniae]